MVSGVRPTTTIYEVTEDTVFEAIREYAEYGKFPDAEMIKDYLEMKMDPVAKQKLKPGYPDLDDIRNHLIKLSKDGCIVMDFKRNGYKIA